MAAVRQVICMLLCSTLLWACDNPASAPLDGGPGDGTSPDSPLPDAEMGDLGPDTVERFVEAGLAAGTHLRVLTANVGNLDGVWKSGCPNYYQGAQCQLKVEQVIAASLASYRPDIVVLNEVFDADYCAGKNEADLANICRDRKSVV